MVNKAKTFNILLKSGPEKQTYRDIAKRENSSLLYFYRPIKNKRQNIITLICISLKKIKLINVSFSKIFETFS